jgi:hypothetical protein
MASKARTANRLLMTARRAMLSPSGSGRPMSRAELADACNQYVAALRPGPSAGQWAGMTASHVGSYERGEIRWPNADYRAALRTVLGATDAELGLYIDRPDRALSATPSAHVGQVFDDQGLGIFGAGLRAGLLSRRWMPSGDVVAGVDVEAAVYRANVAYQSADYASLDALPTVIDSAERWVATSSGAEQDRAATAVVWGHLIASKLASKHGDGALAWVTAERAATWCARLDNPALAAVAAYQIACALAKSPGQPGEAEDVAMTAAEHLASRRRHREPAYLSVRGALLLHAAVTAARRGHHADASLRLATAGRLADALGYDGNEQWTAFGPTNVLIHRLAVTVGLGRHAEALDIGDRLDTSGMPPALLGRRAQVHLDLATVHCHDRRSDPQAVLHLLEAERIAPQVISGSADARRIIGTLLHREQRSVTPGLRALATRAGAI